MFPPRRILVVDDNQDAADTLGALLDRARRDRRASCTAAAAALETFDDVRARSVLLDLGMPGMDGYDVARRIRAMEGHPDTLLIALTGWGQDHDYRQSRAAGFDHHLVKPPDIEHLRELLSEGWSYPAGRGRRRSRRGEPSESDSSLTARRFASTPAVSAADQYPHPG